MNGPAKQSYLALLLHAHLPFVRHPEAENVLEEDWFFEALTESYIPLVAMLHRLTSEGIRFEITMSVTPTLCAMLGDPLLRERYRRYLDRGVALAEREIERTQNDPALNPLAHFYLERFAGTRRVYSEQWHDDLIAPLRALRAAGRLEIIGSAATHGLLPLLQQPPTAARAQVLIGRDVYRETFGEEPSGFWLPECAFANGLEEHLQEANFRWSVLDSHGLLFAEPSPRHAIYAPSYTAAGPAFFARDRTSSRQVWSAQQGYPGHPDYREFYRDLGFELPPSYVWGVNAEAMTPRFTGFKYARVTGRREEKQPYEPARGQAQAEEHASHFLQARRDQFATLHQDNAILVTPFDAELFGHWWFEGPHFLEALIRQAAEFPEIELITPTRYLATFPTQQVVAPAPSSWGENGYFSVWLDEANSWIYPHLHGSARRMTEAARQYRDETSPLATRTLQQMVRELLLMQSSDWAFLMKTGTAKHYATRRVTEHVLRFNRLFDQLMAGQVDERFLRECEERHNLFPNADWRYYL